MHNSNIVYPLIANYLLELRKLGFLAISQDNLKYVITTKGVTFLEKYLSFIKLYNPPELKLTRSLAQLWSRFNLKQKRKLAYERLLDDLEVEQWYERVHYCHSNIKETGAKIKLNKDQPKSHVQ